MLQHTSPTRTWDLRRFTLFWSSLLEIGLIVGWATFVGRSYLTLDPGTVPVGPWNEFGSTIQPHAIWRNLRHCGLCVLWNGALNGGNPGFAELHGAPLHPLVIFATLMWGTIPGAKVAVVASFALAGIAQWWLARVIGLGPLARLWSALLVVTGGHLLSRMQAGVFAVVLSTASCSLILAPLLDVVLNGRRRSALLLSFMLALAAVSGQGYLQIGVVLGIGPAVLLGLLNRNGTLRPVWRELALAVVLAGLLAGIFLVPLVHFWPEFAKDVDPSFDSAQPLRWIPLNLVIDDAEFYHTELLGRQPNPYLYISYITWVPIGFAVLAFRFVPPSHLRMLLFFVVAIVGIYLASSALTLQALAWVFPSFAYGVRNPPLMAGLAVPFIVGLGGYGLHHVLNLPRLRLSIPGRHTRQVPHGVNWTGVAVFPILVWSIVSAYTFNQQWVQTAPRDPNMEPIFERLQTDTAAWVQIPFGWHDWMTPAIDAGLKVSPGWRPWSWKDYPDPPAARWVEFEPDQEWPDYYMLGDAYAQNIFVYSDREQHYAAVITGTSRTPCAARAVGGNIDVECRTTAAGVLEVQEHNWNGWHVRRDGQTTKLKQGPWLGTDAPAGVHHYAFRYRPWDVAIGGFLSITGLLLAILLWVRLIRSTAGAGVSDGILPSGACRAR